MGAYLLEMFSVSLGLTLLLELPLGICLGMRKRKYILLMLLVNVFTNPPAVLLCWLGAFEPLVELVVVMVEAAVYKWFSADDCWEIPHPILLAVSSNVFSWLTGVLIQKMEVIL